MSALMVRLFAHFSVRRDDRDVDGLDASKVQEMFSYLLLHQNHPYSRDMLAGLLWADLPIGQSKKRLSQTLWQLQSALNGQPDQPCNVQLLRIEPEIIQLNSTLHLWLDVGQFEQAFARVQEVSGERLDPDSALSLQSAIQLYQGDLLEGWCQDWCSYERERLQNMYLAMVDKVMVYAEAQRQYETALTYGVSILRYDRAHERTHRRLMRLYNLSGDRTAALRQYERCVTALDEDLGVRPSKRTTTLYERIRTDDVERVDRVAATPRVASDEPGVSLSDALARLRELRGMLASFHGEVQHEIDTVERAISHHL